MVNHIELAADAEWYAAIDVEPWRDRILTLTLDDADAALLDGICTADEPPGDVPPYREALRGGLRFSPRRGWCNDPNGLVLFRGEYHLFFQHNPYGWPHGNMHWGHAVSPDLVHWRELPIAIHTDPDGDVWSGSAVVDTEDTAGFGPGAMVLFYTAAPQHFVQNLVFSQDGRTFEKWSGNPIVPHIQGGNRDPKVIWHAPTRRWVMALYLDYPDKPTIQFLTSSDLKSWEAKGQIVGYHECPDLFELPVEGRPGESRWVVTGAPSDYQIGRFDGENFVPETPILKGHRGRGFYAAQTFSDVPGRRIQVGWYQTETPGMPFNQAMSLPMELGLVADPDGVRMTWTPVPELASLRSEALVSEVEPGDDLLGGAEAELSELDLAFVPSADARLELDLRGVPVAYDVAKAEVRMADLVAPVPPGAPHTLRAFVDRTGVELFAAAGRVYMPMPKNLDPSARRHSLTVTAGTVRFERCNLHRLRSIWEEA